VEIWRNGSPASALEAEWTDKPAPEAVGHPLFPDEPVNAVKYFVIVAVNSCVSRERSQSFSGNA
jgi:hypothetical protein